MDRVLFVVNNTSQSFAQCEIVCKSVFKIIATSSDRSTIMNRLVSSAKSRIQSTLFITTMFVPSFLCR